MLFPTDEKDADPLKGQGSDGNMVSFAASALRLIKALGPRAIADGASSELMKRLTQELGASLAESRLPLSLTGRDALNLMQVVQFAFQLRLPRAGERPQNAPPLQPWSRFRLRRLRRDRFSGRRSCGARKTLRPILGRARRSEVANEMQRPSVPGIHGAPDARRNSSVWAGRARA
jgi:hypothetical protein